MPKPHIIVTGDPASGLNFIGPFQSEEDAITWANHECAPGSWEAAPLDAPDYHA
jgi:hypothetical protein